MILAPPPDTQGCKNPGSCHKCQFNLVAHIFGQFDAIWAEIGTKWMLSAFVPRGRRYLRTPKHRRCICVVGPDSNPRLSPPPTRYWTHASTAIGTSRRALRDRFQSAPGGLAATARACRGVDHERYIHRATKRGQALQVQLDNQATGGQRAGRKGVK